MRVAVPSAASPSDDDLVAGSLEVPEQVAAIAVADQRSGRNLDHQILGASPEFIGTFAVIAALRSPVSLMGEVSKISVAFGGS